jgi:hypothetical protein
MGSVIFYIRDIELSINDGGIGYLVLLPLGDEPPPQSMPVGI